MSIAMPPSDTLASTTCDATPSGKDSSRVLIPPALLERAQWVLEVWTIVDGRPEASFVSPETGRRADLKDPATWASFEFAYEACRVSARPAQVAFVLTPEDPFSAIVLHRCFDQVGDEIAPAAEIRMRLNSYSEMMICGQDMLILVEGKLPPMRRMQFSGIQGLRGVTIFERNRAVVIMGQRFSDTSPNVEPRQAELESLFARLRPGRCPRSL